MFLQVPLLEHYKLMAEALYELPLWRGYLVKILRPIGQTSKKNFLALAYFFSLFCTKVIACSLF
jgi:hypothetical protein